MRALSATNAARVYMYRDARATVMVLSFTRSGKWIRGCARISGGISVAARYIRAENSARKKKPERKNERKNGKGRRGSAGETKKSRVRELLRAAVLTDDG